GDMGLLTVVVDRRDARRRKAADRLRLVTETHQRVLQVDGVEHSLVDGLDRDLPVDGRIERPVDGAHAALTEDAVDAILADIFRCVHVVAGGGQAASPAAAGGGDRRTTLHFLPMATAGGTAVLPPVCS